MGIDLHYCELCKDDFERMRLGYNAHGEDCGRWQCHFLDTMNFLGIMILMVPLIIILTPVFIALWFSNIIQEKFFYTRLGDENAIQGQRDIADVSAGLGDEKQGDDSVENGRVEKRKHRLKKRVKSKKLGKK